MNHQKTDTGSGKAAGKEASEKDSINRKVQVRDMKDHYDVGILGVWYGCNYGSIATYYALQQTIEKLGYSTLMVHYPRLKPR